MYQIGETVKNEKRRDGVTSMCTPISLYIDKPFAPGEFRRFTIGPIAVKTTGDVVAIILLDKNLHANPLLAAQAIFKSNYVRFLLVNISTTNFFAVDKIELTATLIFSHEAM